METDKQKESSDFEKPHFTQYSLGTGTQMIQNDEDWGPTEIGKSHHRPDHYGKGPKNWKNFDEIINEQACAALFASYQVDATDIEVLVKNREVILNGHVATVEEKEEAQYCLEEIDGVVSISNNLIVRPREETPLVGNQKDVGMI